MMELGELIERVETAAQALADSVSFDMNGELMGNRFVGGHGGLISQQTIVKADEVRRAVSSLRRALGRKP